MDYNILLDLATDLGYELAMCGAETFRVEESVSRVLSSYGIASEVFAIPNYLIVTVMMEDGTPITRMRRIGSHGNDLDSVEKFSGLSRAVSAASGRSRRKPSGGWTVTRCPAADLSGSRHLSGVFSVAHWASGCCSAAIFWTASAPVFAGYWSDL